MSALEENLSTEPTTGGDPTPTPEPAAGAEPSPSPAPAATEDRRETLLRIANTAPKSRDERGKFAPSVTLTTTPTPPDTKLAPTTTISERPAMPKSLKKELESHWNTVAPEFAAAIAQRETDYEKGVAPLKERAKVADEFMNVIKPYEQMILADKGTPLGAVKNMLETAAIMRDPAQRLPAIAGLIRQYGISIEDLQQALAGTAPPQQGLNPQYVSQLVDQRFNAFQTEQSLKTTQAEIEKFAANPEHAHFSAVEDWMGAILSAEKFQSEHGSKPIQDKLKAAYDVAVRMDPAIWQQIEAAQQAASHAKQQVSQARKAAVQVRGAPSTGPVPQINPNDRRALIEAQIKARR